MPSRGGSGYVGKVRQLSVEAALRDLTREEIAEKVNVPTSATTAGTAFCGMEAQRRMSAPVQGQEATTEEMVWVLPTSDTKALAKVNAACGLPAYRYKLRLVVPRTQG